MKTLKTYYLHWKTSNFVRNQNTLQYVYVCTYLQHASVIQITILDVKLDITS